MGGWPPGCLPYPGGPFEQPETLMQDILKWKWLIGIAKRQKEKRNKEDTDAA